MKYGAAAVALVVGLGGCTGDVAPTARAQRIASSSQLIGGPKAVGRIGDYLLENDKIRVVIHDQGPGRVSTLFGGTIIDADLVRPGQADGRNGNDQLAEVTPAWLFEVMNPTDVEVTATGADGGAAEITVRGIGDELLQALGLLNAGLLFPPSLAFEQRYRLEPGKQYVEITSSITNTTAGAHALPYLDPSELDALGLPIPGVENLELSVPMGHLLLFGAEQQLFAPGRTGFNVRFGLDDAYAEAPGFPSFPGMVVDHVASRGQGVSYGVAVPSGPNNYVNQFADRYGAAQDVTPDAMLLLFNYSSVAGAYSAGPPPLLASGETFSYTTYFVIGRGDVASVDDVVHELRGDATGGFAGRVLDAQTQAPASDASIIVLAGATDDLVTQISPNERGDFRADLVPGAYRYLVVADDRGRAEPVPFTVTAGATTAVNIQATPPAGLDVFVVDERGRPAPSKVTLVGTFPAAQAGEPARDFLYDLRRGERTRPTSLEATRTDYIEKVVYTDRGRAHAAVPPGTYELVVTRGPEYELSRQPVTLTAGATAQVDVALERAFDTTGWVAMDSHLHGNHSSDSDHTPDTRLRTAAGEGVEIAVATDHNVVSDYSPAVASSGLLDWILALPGIELTTFEMGHFNGFPLQLDPSSTRGGEILWAGQTPTSIFTQLRDAGGGRDQTIVQVNHPVTSILGYFAQFHLDPETGDTYVPQGLSAAFAPFRDEFDAGNFSLDVDAIEIVNAKTLVDVHNFRAPDPLPAGPFPDPQPVAGELVRDAQGHIEYPGTVDTWFTLLDRDLRPTAVGTSDSHGTLLDGEPGFARTMLWLGTDHDVPGTFTSRDVVAAIKGHHAIATNAPLVQLTTLAGGGGMVGDEVASGATLVDVRVQIQAPAWAPVDRVIVWSNGGVKLVDEAIPAGSQTDFDKTYSLDLPVDAWVVAEVTGTQNMFPVVTALEFESVNTDAVIGALGVGFDLSALQGSIAPPKAYFLTPFAITNPIWIDVDGGGWTSPRASLRP